jgi:hypothetical protein
MGRHTPVFGVANSNASSGLRGTGRRHKDLKRYSDFVERKLYDLLLIGRATAVANARDIVETWNLPVTKGLQQSMHAFRKIDEEIELEPLLGRLVGPRRI